MSHKLIVAVDGPAGSGKSTVCRRSALKLGFDYLDTGAGYRAFALHWLEAGRPDPKSLLSSFDYSIGTDPKAESVTLGGRDIASVIRQEQVSGAVSEVARVPEVRKLQLQDARHRVNLSAAPGIIVEGRDITTVVLPEARLRLILTASPEVRQARRGLELADSKDASQVLDRDYKDLQVVDFVNPAIGVELLDTTVLDLDQSVAALVAMIESCKNDV